MFGIGPIELAVGLVVVFLLEIALFWVATALADVPPLGWGKIFLVVLFVTALSVAASGAAFATSASFAETGKVGLHSAAMQAPLAADNRQTVVLGAALALLASWIVPAILYPMLISVSIRRSMWISVLQVLLRAFLYVLIIALVMVVLALIQIIAGSEVRSQGLPPLSPLAMTRVG